MKIYLRQDIQLAVSEVHARLNFEIHTSNGSRSLTGLDAHSINDPVLRGKLSLSNLKARSQPLVVADHIQKSTLPLCRRVWPLLSR